MKNIKITDSQAVFGKNEFAYQCVLDDFPNTNFIGIMTFNISPKTNSQLLKSLKKACLNGTNAFIITNIPKRFTSYYGSKYAVAAKDMINLYKQQLNPHDYGMRLSPYFAFHNHAKVIMTENIVYWGSSNFSDESYNDFECGTISKDKELIKYLKDSLFPEMQHKSVPYYKYNFAVAIANLESLILVCKTAKEKLLEAAFMPVADYDTNFKERFIYRTTDSGITVNFLQKFMDFFSHFDDALNVISEIIDEYWELDELPKQIEILQTLYNEYMLTYDSFNDAISSLFEDLKELAQYDVSDEVCHIIANNYAMEAYDENLDYYAEKAQNEASWEYEDLIKDSEETVKESLDNLDSMIQYFEELYTNLFELLEVNPKIDNTGIK